MTNLGRGPVCRVAGTLIACAALLLLLTLPTFWARPNAHVQVFSVVNFPPLRAHHDILPAPLEKPLYLEKHTYTPDGLLMVNLNGSHPIFELMRNSEAAWAEKLARASQTLEEAVAEYRRRYKRSPPLGFDKWWDFVVEHNVQLPDEYDEIYHDLEAYWGLDPADIVDSLEELEVKDTVFTLAKTPSNSRLEIVHSTFPETDHNSRKRMEEFIEMTEAYGGDLPPMRIVFSSYDNPSMHTDWRIKHLALEAAKSGTTIPRSQLPPISEGGWIQACAPDSPAWTNPPTFPSFDHSTLTLSNTSSPKSFIASHRSAMDPCQNPELLVTHSQFLSHREGPFPEQILVPRFSHCGTLLHHDIRPPIPYGWTSGDDAEANGDVPWTRKVDERLNWRGRTTGLYASPDTFWMHSQRQRLVTLTNTMEGNVSVLRVPVDASSPAGEVQQLRKARVNPAWTDVAFVEKAIACKEDTGTCKIMEDIFEFRKSQGRWEEGKYKFILDVDGNGWSGRFKRLITSNALVFKATVYPEWYTSRIAEWVHYVPIQVAYSDLYDALAFFRVHDDAAAKIAAAGKKWSQQFWRKEDMSAYLYRLLLEYARVTSPDRESMSYDG